MISTATTASQTSQANYQPTGNSQVHSAGCIKNGQAICVCDRPASRYISRTVRNPGRAFYRCGHGNCSFWRWEDELLGAGLVPPEDSGLAPPRSPSSFQQKKGHSTNDANANDLSTPQSLPPAKRSYAYMSTGGLNHTPHTIGGVGVSPKTGIHLSDEAKLAEKRRREADIQTALDEMKTEDEEDNMNEYTDSDADVAMYVRAKSVKGNTGEEGKGLFHPDYNSSDEERLEGYTSRASKKTRISSVKKGEPEGGVLPSTPLSQSQSRTQNSQVQAQAPDPCTPPPRPISTTIQLPTPLETMGRKSTLQTGADDLYEHSESVPPSPTSFTKGAQRAQNERRLSIKDFRGAGVSTSSLAPLNKGKSRAVSTTFGEPSANFDANQIDGHRVNALQVKVDLEEPTQGTARNTINVGPFSKFFRGLSRVLTAAISNPASAQDSQMQTPNLFALVDSHASNPCLTSVQKQEIGHERERKSQDFAKQLASTIQLANSSSPLPTSSQILSHVHNNHSKDQNSARNTSAHPVRSPPPSSTLLSLLSKMSEHQIALQTAASNMAVQQMTFQAAVHDFIAEYDKMGRRVRELEGNVEKKERENAELIEIVDEYRKRNAELEAFHNGLEQFFQTSSPTKRTFP